MADRVRGHLSLPRYFGQPLSLVFFRVLQGLAGGGLVPVEQAILLDTFAPQKRAVALAAYGMTIVLAPAIGPTLGGYITDYELRRNKVWFLKTGLVPIQQFAATSALN